MIWRVYENTQHTADAACAHDDLPQVVGKVSPWVDPDALDEGLRLDSEAALQQELAWAAHLSLQACNVARIWNLRTRVYLTVAVIIMTLRP